ncbi:TPA: hypothetical protein ACKQDV_004665 [Pseudomonas aeruginosa]|uniref:hypothetical protein n=1 Tax=Pseudomonas aeruginosa TaxID=287 RepID=UPI000E31C6B9|nr:hypothetical protein [Pseudomonas aeruginosa]NQA01612.1 hypothetical protein [Pseudomonas aeruginosa]
MSEVKKISPVGNIYGWEESQFGEFVLSQDYDDLAEEAQALREEVAELRARVVVVPDAANDRRKSAHYCRGWNACLDELARLNGKVVSEGLLRDLLKSAQKLSDRAAGFAVSGVEFIEIGDNNSAIVELEVTLDELRALLDEGKENGHA